MTENTLPPFAQIADDFAFIDDWDERYRYLIDLGGRLPPLSDEEHGEENKVRGCASQVWLTFDDGGDGIHIRGDSDAAIVRGLVGLIISLYDGKTAQEILDVDPETHLQQLDLKDHITPQRSNGVASMISRIRDVASQRL